MDKDARKCQDDEPFDQCISRKYIDDLKHRCKCFPLNLRITNEVNGNLDK